jgi:hypothetical protein
MKNRDEGFSGSELGLFILVVAVIWLWIFSTR